MATHDNNCFPFPFWYPCSIARLQSSSLGCTFVQHFCCKAVVVFTQSHASRDAHLTLKLQFPPVSDLQTPHRLHASPGNLMQLGSQLRSSCSGSLGFKRGWAHRLYWTHHGIQHGALVNLRSSHEIQTSGGRFSVLWPGSSV